MAKNILLHIMDILKDTDELNQLKRKDLENRLKAIGIENVDRHTIRKCIDTLNDIGMDIAIERGRENSYYLRERIFEEWEIKLISDMVSECVFLSKKDSTKLIEKLERFTGIENRKLLNETSLYRKKSETI